LDGNHTAEKILYEKYSKIVKNFIKSKYSVVFDLEDDVSEIMIRVFLNLNTYKEDKSKFRSWVYSIAKNYMIDKWRSNTIPVLSSNTYSVTINMEDNVEWQNCNNITNTTLNDSNIFFAGQTYTSQEFENSNSVCHLSSQLSAVDFTLLDMKYVQGYDYCEIGKEFNLTSSTVSNRVNYIKTKLKKKNCEFNYY
jgi:RNA polymerase sigma-70 factor (ECF subfamily)